MVRTKRQKWLKNRSLERVFEPPVREIVAGREYLRGSWHAEVFGNDAPITLELGCGKGAYTVELGRRYPDRNFIGVDIKGHRFYTGAQAAHDEGLQNVAFLRTKIEFIERTFAPAEAGEIWITFCEPHPEDERGTKRLTSPLFFQRYRRILAPGSLVHVKSDSPVLYERTLEELAEGDHEVSLASDDVHGRLVHGVDDELRGLLEIRTDYEERWIDEGRRIHYIQVRV